MNSNAHMMINGNIRIPREWENIRQEILPLLTTAIEAHSGDASNQIYANINNIFTKLYKVHNIFWFKKYSLSEILEFGADINRLQKSCESYDRSLSMYFVTKN